MAQSNEQGVNPIKSEDELRDAIDKILIASAGTLPQGEKDKFFYEVLDARRSEMLELITNLTRQHERKLVEAKRNGFYMACGLTGVDESRVEELWDKCIAQLTTNQKGEK